MRGYGSNVAQFRRDLKVVDTFLFAESDYANKLSNKAKKLKVALAKGDYPSGIKSAGQKLIDDLEKYAKQYEDTTDGKTRKEVKRNVTRYLRQPETKKLFSTLTSAGNKRLALGIASIGAILVGTTATAIIAGKEFGTMKADNAHLRAENEALNEKVNNMYNTDYVKENQELTAENAQHEATIANQQSQIDQLQHENAVKDAYAESDAANAESYRKFVEGRQAQAQGEQDALAGELGNARAAEAISRARAANDIVAATNLENAQDLLSGTAYAGNAELVNGLAGIVKDGDSLQKVGVYPGYYKVDLVRNGNPYSVNVPVDNVRG